MEDILKKADIVKKFRNISWEELAQEIEEKGKYKVLSDFAEIMDKRSYFTVDVAGNIQRKQANPILLHYPQEENVEKLAKMILEYGEPKERQQIHAVSRLSNVEIPKLQEKLMTTLVHGNFDYAKRYAKELYLRNGDTFFAQMELFVSLGKEENQKKEVLEAFRKCMKEVAYEERLFYLYLSFLTRYRDNY